MIGSPLLTTGGMNGAVWGIPGGGNVEWRSRDSGCESGQISSQHMIVATDTSHY